MSKNSSASATNRLPPGGRPRASNRIEKALICQPFRRLSMTTRNCATGLGNARKANMRTSKLGNAWLPLATLIFNIGCAGGDGGDEFGNSLSEAATRTHPLRARKRKSDRPAPPLAALELAINLPSRARSDTRLKRVGARVPTRTARRAPVVSAASLLRLEQDRP